MFDLTILQDPAGIDSGLTIADADSGSGITVTNLFYEFWDDQEQAVFEGLESRGPRSDLSPRMVLRGADKLFVYHFLEDSQGFRLVRRWLAYEMQGTRVLLYKTITEVQYHSISESMGDFVKTMSCGGGSSSLRVVRCCSLFELLSELPRFDESSFEWVPNR